MKDILTPANLVIQQNQGLAGKEGKMGTLAQLLAKESFFSEDVIWRKAWPAQARVR